MNAAAADPARRALVVEDDPAVAVMVQVALESEGFAVTEDRKSVV